MFVFQEKWSWGEDYGFMDDGGSFMSTLQAVRTQRAPCNIHKMKIPDCCTSQLDCLVLCSTTPPVPNSAVK